MGAQVEREQTAFRTFLETIGINSPITRFEVYEDRKALRWKAWTPDGSLRAGTFGRNWG